MAIKIYAQNALDAFSKKEPKEAYLRTLQELPPDIAIFTEAYLEGEETLLPSVTARLHAMEYEEFHGHYDDLDGRQDRHGILLTVRRDLLTSEKPPKLIRIAQRKCIECWIRDPNTNQEIHFIGVHLNDRSEAKRQAEVDDLLEYIDTTTPTIIAGDLNNIHRSDAKGKQFRRAKLIHALVRLKIFPKSEPTGKPEPMTLARRGSIYFRRHEMASGKTIARLQEAGLRDADESHHPTWPAHHPSLQLDHIMLSAHCTAEDFTVIPKGSSDHLGVAATIAIPRISAA